MQTDTAEQIAALEHDYRKTPTGRRLRRAHLLAIASAGDFDGAFTEIAALKGDGEAGETGAKDLWRLLAETGTDEALLRHGLRAQSAPEAARKTADSMGQRLIGLGFPEAARSWATIYAPPSDAETLILAQAALDEGDPGTALATLQDMTGDMATRLRAQALAASGDHDAAAEDLWQGRAAGRAGPGGVAQGRSDPGGKSWNANREGRAGADCQGRRPTRRWSPDPGQGDGGGEQNSARGAAIAAEGAERATARALIPLIK